jgi:hypothetical protein
MGNSIIGRLIGAIARLVKGDVDDGKGVYKYEVANPEYIGDVTKAEAEAEAVLKPLMGKNYRPICCNDISLDVIVSKNEARIVILRDKKSEAYYCSFKIGNEIEEAALAVLYADIGKFLNTNNPMTGYV